MGAGSWSSSTYKCYSKSLGRDYDTSTGRVSGHEFTTRRLDESLDPSKFEVRECVNSEEHPNTIPVILALDVTGSMGNACKETAEALNVIITNLYDKFKDIEFCIMGIGDLECDNAPIQMGQFESDVRIAKELDKIYMEHGGGGNRYESYTAAWYVGLKKTKLDCFDKQGRKGIIITMGDEPLNPVLHKDELNEFANVHEQDDVKTDKLYSEAHEKFDIFHIAVDDHDDMYRHYKKDIEDSFGQLLGDRYKVSTINQLAPTIESCISESIQGDTSEATTRVILDENGEITW